MEESKDDAVKKQSDSGNEKKEEKTNYMMSLNP